MSGRSCVADGDVADGGLPRRNIKQLAAPNKCWPCQHRQKALHEKAVRNRTNIRTGPSSQVPQMLQSLLADRFHLAFHHETRTVSAYELVAAKNGPTLHEAPADKGQGLGSGPRMIRSKGASMAALVDKLGEMLECPVVDRTGLQGIYSFDLAFAPIQPDPSGNDSGPSIFSALQEQMGLKLEKTKAPVEVTVIDRAEKPSAN